MFVNNKYTRWYYNIINSAKENSSYVEKHHIIPKSLGGTNEASNIVKLTAKQHFVCHMLLIKMVPTKLDRYKMACALNYMAQKNTKSSKGYTSKSYEKIKPLICKIRSERMKENNPFKGKKHSKELKLWLSVNNPAKRDEVREKMRKPKRPHKRPPCSPEKAAAISATLTGRKLDANTRKNISDGHKKLRWINKDGLKKMVNVDKIQEWIDQGWSRGRGCI